MLNQIRTGVAPAKSDVIHWGLKDMSDNGYKYEKLQDTKHLLVWPNSPELADQETCVECKPVSYTHLDVYKRQRLAYEDEKL